jgi:hypothetical protein
LLEAAGRVKPRILLEGAESTFHRDLTAPFPGLLEAAGRVKPRILLEGAESTFHRDLVPPEVIEPKPPPTGSLSITSRPEGAEVYLDDELRGRTPLTLEDLAPGSYELMVTLEGYEDWERSVVVRAGVITSVMAELTALPLPTGSLSITSRPEGAEVYLDDEFRGRTPLTLEDLAPGSYRLKVTLEGYQEWGRTVVVRAGVITSVMAELTALPLLTGSLSITSLPSGARVYLDDELRGRTPLTLEDLAPGSYRLKVTLEGYQEWGRTVVVRAGVITPITAELTALPPPTGSLSITSRPEGAEVYLDDEFRGRTPLTLEELAPGSYQLKVILGGYQEWSKNVVVRAGVITSVTAELTALPPLTGSLSITSEPPGADVYINDDFRGRTPLTLEDLATGSYRLKVTLEGYEDWERTVVVRAGVITSVMAELTTLPPPTGSLSITSRPEGAEVYLDDDFRGRTPLTLENLPPGSYRLKVILEGYEDWERSVVVRAGVITSVMAELTALPPPTGSLSITSRPEGAEVYLDDDFRGRTPLTLEELVPGSYRLKVTLEGYQEWGRTVVVRAGVITSVIAELTALPLLTGSLSIASQPEGAEVYLDDDFRGPTPLTLEELAPGSHQLKVILGGYQEWSKTVVVRAGVITSVAAELTALPPPTGSLSLTSRPSGGAVYLDDEYKGLTPLTLDLEPGEYGVAIRKSGYQEWSTMATIKPGERATLSSTLAPLPILPPDQEPAAPPTPLIPPGLLLPLIGTSIAAALALLAVKMWRRKREPRYTHDPIPPPFKAQPMTSQETSPQQDDW